MEFKYNWTDRPDFNNTVMLFIQQTNHVLYLLQFLWLQFQIVNVPCHLRMASDGMERLPWGADAFLQFLVQYNKITTSWEFFFYSNTISAQIFHFNVYLQIHCSIQYMWSVLREGTVFLCSYENILDQRPDLQRYLLIRISR